jgi:integrase
MDRVVDLSRKPNTLLLACVKVPTQNRYSKTIALFLEWLFSSNGGCQPSTIIRIIELDALLAQYLQYLYSSGNGKGIAACTIAGLVAFHPEIKWSIPLSRRCLPWGLTVLLAGIMSCQRDEVSYGICTLVGFDCYMRPGELLAVKTCDVVFAGDARLESSFKGAMIRLPRTKTDIVLLLRVMVEDALEEKRVALWPFTINQWRRAFYNARDTLGLSSKFVPHSLRHGGATAAARAHVPINDIMIRGRWRSYGSLTRYVQQWEITLLSHRVPLSISSLCRDCESDILGAIVIS